MLLISDRTDELSGRIKVPPSKSYTHRAVIASSIDTSSTVRNPLVCDDTLRTIDACRILGASIEGEDPLHINGFDGSPNPAQDEINLGESGTSLRLLVPLAALAKKRVVLTGVGSLLRRPNNFVSQLRSIGVDAAGVGDSHNAPIVVNGRGFISGGEITLRGLVSSQFVSSLLISCPLALHESRVRIDGTLTSKPYVDVTMDVLERAGVKVENESYREFTIPPQQHYKPVDYEIHGDYSSASFLIAAACLIPSDVVLDDLVMDKQGDRRIVEIVEEMGAKPEVHERYIRISGPYDLEGIDVDCIDTPDLVPVIAALGAFAKGETRMRNIPHLRGKESDRIAAMSSELRKLGAEVVEEKDEMIVRGSRMHGGVVSSHGDHRIAMALSLVGLRAGKVCVDGGECINKSYPSFVEHMRILGANIRII